MQSGAVAATSEPLPKGPALALTERQRSKVRGFMCLEEGGLGPGAARPSAWPFSIGDITLGDHSGQDGASVWKYKGTARQPRCPPHSQTHCASLRPRSSGCPGSAQGDSGTRGPLPRALP